MVIFPAPQVRPRNGKRLLAEKAGRGLAMSSATATGGRSVSRVAASVASVKLVPGLYGRWREIGGR